MSYFVMVCFELKNADNDVYEKAYLEMEAMGLTRTMVAMSGEKVTLPPGIVSAKKKGTSERTLRDSIAKLAKGRLADQGIQGDLFIFVSDDPAWKHNLIE